MKTQRSITLIRRFAATLMAIGGIASTALRLFLPGLEEIRARGAYLYQEIDFLERGYNSMLIAAIVAMIGTAIMGLSSLALLILEIKSRDTKIQKAPGSRFLSFVEFFYSPKTVELTFKPIVAEWHHEIFEALKEGRTRKVYWISMRNRWYFLKAMGLSKVWEAVEKVVGLVKKG